MRKWIIPSAWINSSQADEVANYYLNHSSMETAEHFGITKAQVDAVVKVRGISNGRDANWYRRKDAEQKIAELVDQKGFEYISGYTNKHGKVLIRCKTCNYTFERTVDCIKRKNLSCDECKHRKNEAHIRKKKEVEANNAYIQNLENQWLKLLSPPEDHNRKYYKKAHEAFLDRKGICEICGKAYTVREYMESTGAKKANDNGVCSTECKKAKQRRLKQKFKTPSNHRHRAKKYGVPYESGITLQKIIKRNGLTCAICGKECNLNDHEWSEYAGPTYPSIDHIIPMAKGGGHTWDNVQVACMMCNSLKSDNI